MLHKSTIILWAFLACGLRQPGLAAGGQILGVVKGDDGSAVVGAGVLLKETVPPGAPARQATSRTAATTAGGAFQFDLLPTGQYTLCAQAPSGNWLASCDWGGVPTSATVVVAQGPASATIVLKKGAVVPISVNDPQQLLAQNEGITPGAHLLLGVASPSLIFHVASITAQNSSGRSYATTIPFGAAANLVVASSFFALADATGTALASASTVPISAPSGQTPPTITLSVTGHR
jgi:hypothetical protein